MNKKSKIALGSLTGLVLLGTAVGCTTATHTVTHTVRVPGPTVTKTIHVPGPTVTHTVHVPGPTVTHTVTAPAAPAAPAPSTSSSTGTCSDVQTVIGYVKAANYEAVYDLASSDESKASNGDTDSSMTLTTDWGNLADDSIDPSDNTGPVNAPAVNQDLTSLLNDCGQS
jgi:hypothetical protein